MTYPIGQNPPSDSLIASLQGNNELLRRELRFATDANRGAFWRGVVIGGLLVGCTLIAGAAFAETRMTLEGRSASCFAVVAIENRSGSYNQDETLETTHGPVVLHYRTIGGHNALDHDEVTVISLPDGVTADPSFMALPDGETGRICLAEWIGG